MVAPERAAAIVGRPTQSVSGARKDLSGARRLGEA